jgi:hypothetical protein
MSKQFATMCKNPHFIAAASDCTTQSLSFVDKLRGKAAQGSTITGTFIGCCHNCATLQRSLLVKYVVLYDLAGLHQSEIQRCAAPQRDCRTVQYTHVSFSTMEFNYASSPTSVPFFAPAFSFIAIAPVIFDVSEAPFDLRHCFGVTRVLTSIVADLDCRPTAST